MKYREKCLKQKINACWVCGAVENLLVHHINGDRDDNRLGNLIPVCQECHAKVHTYASKGPVVDSLTEKLPEDTLIDKRWIGRERATQSVSTIQLDEATRDELRKYKSREGLTYDEAVQRLFQETGWYDE